MNIKKTEGTEEGKQPSSFKSMNQTFMNDFTQSLSNETCKMKKCFEKYLDKHIEQEGSTFESTKKFIHDNLDEITKKNTARVAPLFQKFGIYI